MERQRLGDEPTRADVLECLAMINREAKREQCIVEKFTTDPPTAWSMAHSLIDGLLSDLAACDGAG